MTLVLPNNFFGFTTNVFFVFGLLCKSVIGNPQKLTTRKFYGNHFHSITIHLPETARLFCLKSIVPEQEERSFGTLRRISENTTNRQPKFVVDNAMLSMKFQTSLNNPTETIAKQNSTVSKQVKLLPAKNGQYYNHHCSKNFPCLFKVTWNVLQSLFFLEKMSSGRLMPRMVWYSMTVQKTMKEDQIDHSCTTFAPDHWKRRECGSSRNGRNVSITLPPQTENIWRRQNHLHI